MSCIDQLIKVINDTQTKTYNSEFDLGKFLMKDKDIVKNIIALKNPKLSKDDISLMVDDDIDFENQLPKVPKKPNFKIDKIRIDSLRIRKSGVYPISKDSDYYKEALKIKEEFKKAFFILFKGLKNLSKRIINLGVLASSSIPAITMMVVSIPWNIPAAISTVMLIVDSASGVIELFKSIIPELSPLKNLKIVCDKKKACLLANIIKSIINKLVSIFDAVKSKIEFINTIPSLLIKLIKDNKSKILSNIRNRLFELKYLIIDKGKVKTDRNLVSNSEVIEILKNYDVTSTGNVSFKNDNNIDSLTKELENLNSSNNDLEKELSTILIDNNDNGGEDDDLSESYDVILPNGTTLYNLSPNELEDLKKVYQVTLKN
jgi:hypothetical protein